MPFTPAHAAAALPIRRLLPRLPFSAVVIGTMSPDYEYFLRLAPAGRLAHSLAGIALFCVPVGMLLWAGFTRVVRPALVALMPDGLARAMPPASTSIGLAAIGVALGALTHLVWDSFTHAHDWTAEHWPLLRTPVAPRLLPGLAWYKLLQHASTVVGLAVLLIVVIRWVRATPAAARRFTPEARARALGAVGVTIAAAAVGTLLNGVRGWDDGIGQAAALGSVGGMLGIVVGLVSIGLWHAWHARGTGRSTS